MYHVRARENVNREGATSRDGCRGVEISRDVKIDGDVLLSD